MGEWPVRALGELVDNFDGRRVPVKESDRRPGPYPYYGASGVVDHVDGYLFDGEYLLVAEDGENLRTRKTPVAFLASGRFWVNNHAHILKANGEADTRFLNYALSVADIGGYITGSTMPKLTQGNLHKIPVVAPPLADQRRIADMLGALDDKIELNRRMSGTLEASARALFKSWFVDFNPVRGISGAGIDGLAAPFEAFFSGPLEETDLGPVPVGWRVVPLSDVLAELETGGRPKGGVARYETGIPSIGAESIVGLGIFDFAKTKYIPKGFYDGMSKGRVRNRDVLLYKDGGRPGEYRPHLTLVGDGFPFSVCAINEHVYRIRAIPDLGQNYLFYWLSSGRAMEEMAVKGTGVAIPGLNSTQVRSLAMLVPPPEVTRAFEVLVEPLTARILTNGSQSRTLGELRDALLSRLLSGDLEAAA